MWDISAVRACSQLASLEQLIQTLVCFLLQFGEIITVSFKQDFLNLFGVFGLLGVEI